MFIYSFYLCNLYVVCSNLIQRALRRLNLSRTLFIWFFIQVKNRTGVRYVMLHLKRGRTCCHTRLNTRVYCSFGVTSAGRDSEGGQVWRGMLPYTLAKRISLVLTVANYFTDVMNWSSIVRYTRWKLKQREWKCKSEKRDTVEAQWIEHLWDHGTLFEIWVVRATEVNHSARSEGKLG